MKLFHTSCSGCLSKSDYALRASFYGQSLNVPWANPRGRTPLDIACTWGRATFHTSICVDLDCLYTGRLYDIDHKGTRSVHCTVLGHWNHLTDESNNEIRYSPRVLSQSYSLLYISFHKDRGTKYPNGLLNVWFISTMEDYGATNSTVTSEHVMFSNPHTEVFLQIYLSSQVDPT